MLPVNGPAERRCLPQQELEHVTIQDEGFPRQVGLGRLLICRRCGLVSTVQQQPPVGTPHAQAWRVRRKRRMPSIPMVNLVLDVSFKAVRLVGNSQALRRKWAAEQAPHDNRASAVGPKSEKICQDVCSANVLGWQVGPGAALFRAARRLLVWPFAATLLGWACLSWRPGQHCRWSMSDSCAREHALARACVCVCVCVCVSVCLCASAVHCDCGCHGYPCRRSGSRREPFCTVSTLRLYRHLPFQDQSFEDRFACFFA